MLSAAGIGLQCVQNVGIHMKNSPLCFSINLFNSKISAPETRTSVKSVYQKFNFFISQPRHMLWVLKKPSQ